MKNCSLYFNYCYLFPYQLPCARIPREYIDTTEDLLTVFRLLLFLLLNDTNFYHLAYKKWVTFSFNCSWLFIVVQWLARILKNTVFMTFIKIEVKSIKIFVK